MSSRENGVRTAVIGGALFGSIVVLGFLIIVLFFPALLTGVTPGQPVKNPITNQYTVYIAVNGHRDRTFFHENFHANTRIDSVTFYFSNPPTPPSGQTWADFDKNIHVTLTITGSSLQSPIVNTFDVTVSVGAQWGKVLMYTLPSGAYTIEASGVDQDGFQSTASGQMNLP